jgi:hypothetical protein
MDISDIPLNCYYNERSFRQKLYVQYLLLENRAVYETMWKDLVEPDRPQMTISYRAYALHAG